MRRELENKNIRNIQKSQHTYYVSLPIEAVKALDNQDFDDGLHPNAKGHEKIFNHVRDFLTEKRWI